MYQYDNRQDNQPVTNKQPTSNQPVTTYKNDKKGKNGENKKKEDITSIATQSVAGVNDIIKLFEPINPAYERLYKNTTQRKAVERLLKKHGLEKVSGVIKSLVQSNGMEYAPTITTPLQLEEKLGSLVAFWQKKGNQQSAITKIS